MPKHPPPTRPLPPGARDGTWRDAAEWRDLAACQGLDVRLFYPDSGQRSGPAISVCSGCRVRAACLEHALATGEAHGVWGGATEDERRAIRRARREQAQATPRAAS